MESQESLSLWAQITTKTVRDRKYTLWGGVQPTRKREELQIREN